MRRARNEGEKGGVFKNVGKNAVLSAIQVVSNQRIFMKQLTKCVEAAFNVYVCSTQFALVLSNLARISISFLDALPHIS